MEESLNKRTLYIHQIYGIFKDDKRLIDNELFLTSMNKYLEIIHKNNMDNNRSYNYIYKLWSDEDCNNLIAKYPEFNYYHDVRYKIMKVDIIRFLILYEYGGIYSDLDVIPRIDNFDFILSPINCDKIYVAQYINKYHNLFDIEIIMTGLTRNKILYDYLLYVKTQIEEKNKIDIYKKWKIRYVFQTTGPRAFNRFIKPKKYNDYIKSLDTLYLPETITITDNIEEMDLENIIFLSYHSLSYNDELHQGKYVGYSANYPAKVKYKKKIKQ